MLAFYKARFDTTDIYKLPIPAQESVPMVMISLIGLFIYLFFLRTNKNSCVFDFRHSSDDGLVHRCCGDQTPTAWSY